MGDRARGAAALAEPPRAAEDEVRRRAYELYEERGGEQGHDWDDWFRAEQEVRSSKDRDRNNI
jgi:Protein of unknown function (DUF2934)